MMNPRKGEPTGADRDACHVKVRNGEENGWGQRRQKRSYGAGLPETRGTLRRKSKETRKKIAGTGGGGQQEGTVSRWTVNFIPEERGKVGCKKLVKLSRPVADRGVVEGCRT